MAVLVLFSIFSYFAYRKVDSEKGKILRWMGVAIAGFILTEILNTGVLMNLDNEFLGVRLQAFL